MLPRDLELVGLAPSARSSSRDPPALLRGLSARPCRRSARGPPRAAGRASVVERLRDLVLPADLLDRAVAAQAREHDLELLLRRQLPVLALPRSTPSPLRRAAHPLMPPGRRDAGYAGSITITKNNQGLSTPPRGAGQAYLHQLRLVRSKRRLRPPSFPGGLDRAPSRDSAAQQAIMSSASAVPSPSNDGPRG